MDNSEVFGGGKTVSSELPTVEKSEFTGQPYNRSAEPASVL